MEVPDVECTAGAEMLLGPDCSEKCLKKDESGLNNLLDKKVKVASSKFKQSHLFATRAFPTLFLVQLLLVFLCHGFTPSC